MNERVMGTGEEVSTDEVETGVGNGWKELEELGAKDGFMPMGTNEINEEMAGGDRQDLILSAAEEVRAAYRKNDIVGIETKRGEKRREGETIHIALAEDREEKAARESVWQEEARVRAIEEERQRIEREASKARMERESLTRDMSNARDALDYYKQDRFEKQRIQEIVERDLNSNLLTIDNLEVEVVSENPGIQKRSVSFGDADIPVYDLRGIPFAILSTTIDYRSGNKPGEIGTETFKRVMEDPAVWAERRDKAERASGFGTENGDARGDTISTSYWNSERNIGSHVVGDLIYGFENIQADSIISVSNGDGGTSNMSGRSETTLHDMEAIKKLEGAGGTLHYNEVLLRRYTENGIPKKPDYIIAENGKITEVALRHAKYFGVPIVNVERSIYEKNSERKGNEILASISENDSYEEMDSKLAELSSMTKYKHLLPTLGGIGRNPRPLWSFTDKEKQGIEIAKMEQLKRLDFIKKTLENAARDIDSATEGGLSIGWQEIPGFDHFSVSINDIQNDVRRNEYHDVKGASKVAPGNCSWIDVEFRLKNSSRHVKTRIYDGGRIYEVDKALANGMITEEDIKNADSNFYNMLEPVVLRYFEAYRKNQDLTANANKADA